MTELERDRHVIHEQFIGSALDLDNFVYYLEEGFNADLLNNEEARAIWHYMKEYYDQAQRRSIPPVEVLQEQFPNFRYVEPKVEPHWILGKLKKDWEHKEAQALNRNISNLMPDKIFPYVRQKLFEADSVLTSERNVISIHNMDEMMDDYWAAFEAGELSGVTTGFEEIDAEMGGIRKGQLAVVGGRLKTGKTWFGLKAFMKQRHKGEIPIFFTLELSPEEIWRRMMALWSGVSFDRIDKGYLSPDESSRLREAVKREREEYGPYYIIQPPPGERKVSDFLTSMDKYKGTSMIIDQLSWIEARMSNRDYFRDDLRVGDIAKDLKLAAQRPGREIPVYVMHQLNRQQRDDGELDSANYADSDNIGRIADHLFGIQQGKELREVNQIRFEVMRSRSARSGGMFTCDFEFYEKTNMDTAFRGETLGDMTPEDAAILLGSGSIQT